MKTQLTNGISQMMIPLGRQYIRYSPVSWGKSQIWAALHKYFSWRSIERTIVTDDGILLQGNTMNLLPRFIYYFGVWEPDITAYIKSALSSGDTFIDVGANIGYYSLLASSLVGKTGNVVAVEASPRIYNILLKNLDLNHATNVRTVNVAASDTSGRLPIFEALPENLGQTTTVKSFADRNHCTLTGTVEALPLTEILTPAEVQRARIVKIDVEGAERMVAQGLLPVLCDTRDDIEIVMEISPDDLALQGGTADELIGKFTSLGFNAYSVNTDYSMKSYVRSVQPARPGRLRARILNQTDVVLSRVDRDEL